MRRRPYHRATLDPDRPPLPVLPADPQKLREQRIQSARMREQRRRPTTAGTDWLTLMADALATGQPWRDLRHLGMEIGCAPHTLRRAVRNGNTAALGLVVEQRPTGLRIALVARVTTQPKGTP